MCGEPSWKNSRPSHCSTVASRSRPTCSTRRRVARAYPGSSVRSTVRGEKSTIVSPLEPSALVKRSRRTMQRSSSKMRCSVAHCPSGCPTWRIRKRVPTGQPYASHGCVMMRATFFSQWSSSSSVLPPCQPLCSKPCGAPLVGEAHALHEGHAERLRHLDEAEPPAPLARDHVEGGGGGQRVKVEVGTRHLEGRVEEVEHEHQRAGLLDQPAHSARAPTSGRARAAWAGVMGHHVRATCEPPHLGRPAVPRWRWCGRSGARGRTCGGVGRCEEHYAVSGSCMSIALCK
jgi:hypothetical protein